MTERTARERKSLWNPDSFRNKVMLLLVASGIGLCSSLVGSWIGWIVGESHSGEIQRAVVNQRLDYLEKRVCQ